jgi:hypothetical protein
MDVVKLNPTRTSTMLLVPAYVRVHDVRPMDGSARLLPLRATDRLTVRVFRPAHGHVRPAPPTYVLRRRARTSGSSRADDNWQQLSK